MCWSRIIYARRILAKLQPHDYRERHFRNWLWIYVRWISRCYFRMVHQLWALASYCHVVLYPSLWVFYWRSNGSSYLLGKWKLRGSFLNWIYSLSYCFWYCCGQNLARLRHGKTWLGLTGEIYRRKENQDRSTTCIWPICRKGRQNFQVSRRHQWKL